MVAVKPILTEKSLDALYAHMGRHVENSAAQYAAWAKYALKVEMSQKESSDLFLEGLQTGKINFDD
jgi:hypothetical protein